MEDETTHTRSDDGHSSHGRERASGARAGITNRLRQAARAALTDGAPEDRGPEWLERQAVRQFAVYNGIHELGVAYQTLIARDDLTRFERRVFSQNGEDGVICELLRRVGPRTRRFVEIGTGSGVEMNCALLVDVFGWGGVFVEGDALAAEALQRKYDRHASVRVLRAFVSPTNVNELLKPDVAEGADVISIDIDGNDYYLWEALSCVAPLVVVIEYNSALDPEANLVQRFDPESRWDRTASFGASIGALRHLGRIKGYTLVHTELAGVNAFFVRDDMLTAVGLKDQPVVRRPNYWLAGLGHPSTPDLARFVDVSRPR